MCRRVAIAIALLMLAGGDSAAYDLRQHQWRNRLLFLVIPRMNDPGLAAQQRWLEGRRDAVLDRDIRVFRLSLTRGLVDGRVLTGDEVKDLRQWLGVSATDRLVILIGKDGGIKRRAPLSTDLREILLQIDNMPMRREEMRAKKDAGIEATPP